MNPKGYTPTATTFGKQFRWGDLGYWDKPEEVKGLVETTPTGLNLVLIRYMKDKNGGEITLTKLVHIEY